MLDKSEHDMSQQQAELIELTTMWDRVCKLSVIKQERIEQAHKLVGDIIYDRTYRADNHVGQGVQTQRHQAGEDRTGPQTGKSLTK